MGLARASETMSPIHSTAETSRIRDRRSWWCWSKKKRQVLQCRVNLRDLVVG